MIFYVSNYFVYLYLYSVSFLLFYALKKDASFFVGFLSSLILNLSVLVNFVYSCYYVKFTFAVFNSNYLVMYYSVISYNSKTDTLIHHRITESKSEALRWVREDESTDGIDYIRLFIDAYPPKI